MNLITRLKERIECGGTCCDCSRPVRWYNYRGRAPMTLVRCHACAALLWEQKLQAVANGAGETRH